MKKHIAFKKIGQYRNAITDMRKNHPHVGPVQFTGTVKLHGTNAGVCVDETGEVWAQSRSRIITPGDDNAGFAAFAEERKDAFECLLHNFRMVLALAITEAPKEHVLTLFGEWCGGSIQKGVALNQVEKRFVIFSAVLSWTDEEGEEHKRYFAPTDMLLSPLSSSIDGIYNILDYQTFEITVDANSPEQAQHDMLPLVEQVEACCPVGKAFGVEGVGEGIVWSAVVDNDVVMFKTKGQKHSISKVKTVAPVDIEKVANVKKFVEYAVTENRMLQAIQEASDGTGGTDIRKLGVCIKWLMSDINKEEADVLAGNGLAMKDVSSACIGAFKTWFMEQL